MKQRSLMKRVSAVLMAATLTISTFTQFHTEVHAEENQLPTIEQFATVEELKTFDTNDQDEDGKNPAKVYFGNNDQQWWIAGSQDGNLTLFAASPLAKGQPFKSNSDQNEKYEEYWNCDYTSTGGTAPTEVYPNHYGASPLRTTLNGLESSYFTDAEQGLMTVTKVYTNDIKNSSVYSTTNKLYLAYGDYNDNNNQYITVGANQAGNLNNGLRIDKYYWGNSAFWLRATYKPYFSYISDALIANPDCCVSHDYVYDHYALVPAFELNLSSVIFASAAPAASFDGSLTLQDTDGKGAFTLRYDATKFDKNLGSALVSNNKSQVTLTNVPENTYLVVQNKDGAKARQITNEKEVSASDMRLENFANCKVWLETTETTNRMTYATLADEEGYDVNITASKGLTVKNGTQGVKKGTVITDITVEVTGGYYLPDDYKDTIQGLNGLNVKDFTKTGFTISGTPTSDVSITLPAASEQPFRVILPDEQIGYTLTVDKSEVEYGGSCTLTFALQEGYVKTGDFRIFSNEKIIYPNDDDKNKYTIKNIQNDITITVTGVNDNTSPDVRITIGDNTWNSFKGVISYGKYFFNKKQNATITATDRSGINKCYYAIDATGNDFNRPTVTNSELDKTLNWIELEGNSISLSEYDHCIIFVKAIDKCGNRTYIVTDGLTLDSTAPQVLGIESNQIYTKSQSFTVVEDNLATVKVDGQTVEPTNGKYTLVPKDRTYIIEVKDKAGNKITLNNITVNWDEVEIPTVKSKSCTGEILTADILGNDLYTVTKNDGGINVGKYDVQLTLKDPTNYRWKNGNSTAIATIEFEIVKANRNAPTSVTATGTTYKGGTDGKLNNVDSSMEYRKDGENEWHSISGDTVEGLSTGKYYVRYKDSKNYYASSDKEVYVANGQEIKVIVPASQVGYTLSVSNTVVDYNESSTLTFALNKGYSKTKDFAVKVNGETVQLDNNNKYKIKNIQKDTNITVEGVADITAPDTEIKVSNKTWKSILNTITFGLFFKETQKAEIAATDEGSGVNKYYYYVDKSGSEESLTEEQLQSVDWKEGTSVTFSEDSNYVIYAKVTDKAGNIKYVSTDGIVIDTIAPQVSGVESNQTYTKTQTFTVTDNNLDTVKVDDKVVTYYTLVPKKGTYTIEVTDKAGNKTTLNNITVNWEKVKKPTVESKVYTGQTLTANISENGLYTVTKNEGDINVGEYDVQLTLKDPTNYRWEDGTIDTTVKFNITQATPVVTKPTTKTLTYNGSEQELVNAASTNGGTVKYSLDNQNWSTSIPTGKDAKEYTVYYKVEGNKNFKDVDVKKITNTINPRTIDLKWNKELTYNGKEQLLTATVNNLADGDDCEVTVSGANRNAGTYEATATKVSNQNYKLPENVTTSYTIGKKQLSIEGLKAVNRKYNGTSEVALQGGTLTGVVGNDKVSIDMPITGTVESSNAGENKTVSYTKTSLSGVDKDNYELSETAWPTLTVTISKTDQSDTRITTTSNELDKEYDGYEIVDVKSTSNNKTTSVVEYSVKGKNEYTTTKPKDAGEYTVRVTYPADDNYEKSSVTKDFTIKKMKTRVSAIDLSKTYGEKGYELMYSFDRLAREDRLTGIILTRQEGEDVGTYKIKVSQKEGSNPNYDITFKDGTYTINPLSIDKGTVVLGNVLKYTGEKQTQEVEQVLVNGKALNKEDYEVLDNQATKEGKHVLTIKAKGNNHTGSFEYAYVVLPKENNKIGTGTLDVKITGEVKVSKDDLIDILIENKQLSANELSEIAEGKEVEFILDVKDSTKTIKKESKELIEANTKGYTIGKYLDITLYKTVNKKNESIHELTKKLKVTISIPEELINKDSKVKREYAIVRNHNGKVEILEGSYDEESHTYTFETDRFSDYAIIYKDTKENSSDKKNDEVVDKDESTSNNQETVKPTVKTETKKVKTGDNFNSIFYMGLIGVSLLGIYCLIMKKFTH